MNEFDDLFDDAEGAVTWLKRFAWWFFGGIAVIAVLWLATDSLLDAAILTAAIVALVWAAKWLHRRLVKDVG